MMVVRAIADRWSPDPHIATFTQLNASLQRPELSHVVVSYGAIDFEEINDKIRDIHERADWDLAKLKENAYWTLFARHVTRISFRAYYYTEEVPRIWLDQIQRVIQVIQRTKGPEGFPIASFDVPSGGDWPRTFGLLKNYYGYNGEEVANFYGQILNDRTAEISLHHLTAATLLRNILPMAINLRVLKIKGLGPYNTYEDFMTVLALLPRGLEVIDLGHVPWTDESVRLLVRRCPFLRRVSLVSDRARLLTDAALTAIGTLRHLSSLALRNNGNYLHGGFSQEGLSALNPNLEELYLDGFDKFEGEETFSLFFRFTKLRALKANCSAIHLLSIAAPLLEELDVGSVDISSGQVRYFRDFRLLRRLVFGGFHYCEVSFLRLRKLEKERPGFVLRLIPEPQREPSSGGSSHIGYMGWLKRP